MQIKAQRVEKWIFILLALWALFPVLSVYHVVTLDGPIHLYNARILQWLFEGNKLIHASYHVNVIPVPNWFSQFVLTALCMVFSPNVAEKVLLSGYLVGMPLSFYYLVQQFMQPGSRGLIYIILPLVYSFPFIMGFYNLCFSFVLLMLIIARWESVRLRLTRLHILVMILLFVILYFTHIFSFCFAVGILVARELYAFFLDWLYSHHKAVSFNNLIKRFGVLVMIVLPAMLLAVIYFFTVKVPPLAAGEKLDIESRFAMLVRLKECVALDGEYANVLGCILGIALCVISIYSLIRRCGDYIKLRNAEENKLLPFLLGDIWLLLSLFSLGLFLFVPDDWNAGMMSDRLLTITLLIFFVWIALQPLPVWLYTSGSVICIFFMPI